MQQEHFSSLLRHLLANIHDHAVLERHPLNEFFPRPEISCSRAEHLRRKVAAAIEQLKPQHLRFDVSATEWRYYLILHGRYVEGANLADLQNQLALGDRQERRLHMRALTLLEAILFEQMAGSTASPAAAGDAFRKGLTEALADGAGESIDELQEEHGEAVSFQLFPELLHVRRVLDEVSDLCELHIRNCGAEIEFDIPNDLPAIHADRIILRQILLHVVNTLLLTWQAKVTSGDQREPIVVSAHHLAETVAITLEWRADAEHPALQQLTEQAPLRYWLEQLHMQVSLTADGSEFESDLRGQPAYPLALRLVLMLPVASQATLLVVDDHESAIRIIQRFLQPTAIRVVGETDPSRVPELARTLRPQLLLLDVMMPTTDGWELLQRLKADPETHAIPVVVCSVWNVPELALSLGASDFLKKPINRGHLFEALARLLSPDVLPGLDRLTGPEN